MISMTTEGGYYSNSKNITLINRLKNCTLDYETLCSAVELSQNMLENARNYGVEEKIIQKANENDILQLAKGLKMYGWYEWQRIAFASYLNEAIQVIDQAIKNAKK